jgi:hypothetical protein
MKKPIYKTYRISYDGKVREEVSATSKKNVREYIKDNYTTYLTNTNGFIQQHFYRLNLFVVDLIEA